MVDMQKVLFLIIQQLIILDREMRLVLKFL